MKQATPKILVIEDEDAVLSEMAFGAFLCTVFIEGLRRRKFSFLREDSFWNSRNQASLEKGNGVHREGAWRSGWKTLLQSLFRRRMQIPS